MKDIFAKHKLGLTFAFSLVIIENIAWIVEPTFFGLLIDAIFDEEAVFYSTDWWQGILYPLYWWIFMYVINTGTGSLRRIVDPRIFMKIFSDIAQSIAETSKKNDYSVAKTTARVQLSFEFINFFEFRVPDIIENIISISGAVIALYFIDFRISLICLGIIFPIIILSKIYSRKVSDYQKQFHDYYEKMFDIFSEKKPETISEYFKNYAIPQRKIGNWNAANFGIIRFILLLIFLFVLYISIILDGLSPGEIYAIVAYLWTFITATEYLPELLESWTSLKDISRRLKAEEI
jgi:ABC-type multidrug transport system fused ATPase/permease subunit